MRRHPLRPNAVATAFVALLTSGLLSTSLEAQIFAGVGSPSMAIPGDVEKQPTIAPVVQEREQLRFLPNTLDGLRLSGETGDLRWPVYLTLAQTSAPIRVRIGYVSALSVLPDTSSLDVKINDRSIGTNMIDGAQGLRVINFAVPRELVRPGYNAVSISVSQRHRVDCSVDATYELWTKIDPTVTGLLVATAARTITDIADLAALLPRSDGTLPIHVVLAGKTNPVHLRHLVTATQQIALSAHSLQPAVDFVKSVDDPYGVDLLLGTRDALGHVPSVAGMYGAVGPLARIIPAKGNGRPIIVVTGGNDAEIDQAIGQMAPGTELAGTPEGRLTIANYPAFLAKSDTHVRLSDLGMRSETFSGRLFHKSFNLMMPADFLASDYGRGTFDLAGGYAAGLTRDAQVRIDVNGNSSGVIKLPYERGDNFTHNQLFLPLSLMRPGLNRIDLIAETVRREDATCAAPDAKRFRLLDSSEIVLPPLARVQRLPDLAVTTGGGMPFTKGHAHLVVPKPDRETMGAALSLTSRAAVAAGAIIPFDFATKVPTDDSGSTLIVSPAQALDPALMKTIGLDPKTVEAAWRHHPMTHDATDAAHEDPQRWWITRSDGPAACHVPAHAINVADRAAPHLPAAAMTSDADPLFDAEDAPASHKWSERLAMLPPALFSFAKSAGTSIHWGGAHAAQSDGIDASASLILAQGISPGSRENVTTIVTAADAATLDASVACLFDPQVWSKVHGRLAVLDASNGEVTATDAAIVHYISSGPMSLSNSRLVVAGWFSLNPFAFVAVALITALCLSGTTLWFVRGVGRRPE